MKKLVITNNSMVYQQFSTQYNVIYDELYTYLDILNLARNKVHEGHSLLTHPLSGSIKPNQTPYKTILLTAEKNELHKDSLYIIEDSIQTAVKFLKDSKPKNWNEKIRDDFRLIDFDLIKDCMDNQVVF